MVEKVEPSLFDGARLIVEVLCIDEAARLANKIASRPQLREQRAFADAFETGLHVIRREVITSIYRIRREKAG